MITHTHTHTLTLDLHIQIYHACVVCNKTIRNGERESRLCMCMFTYEDIKVSKSTAQRMSSFCVSSLIFTRPMSTAIKTGFSNSHRICGTKATSWLFVTKNSMDSLMSLHFGIILNRLWKWFFFQFKSVINKNLIIWSLWWVCISKAGNVEFHPIIIICVFDAIKKSKP